MGKQPYHRTPIRPYSPDAPDSPEEDLLGYADCAELLAAVGDAPSTPTPLTIGVSGDHGVGKTTLMGFVHHELISKPSSIGATGHAVLRFDAWLHDDQPNIKAALVRAVVARANDARPMWRRTISPVHPSILAKAWWSTPALLAGLSLLAYVGLAMMALDIRFPNDSFAKLLAYFITNPKTVWDLVAQVWGFGQLSKLLATLIILVPLFRLLRSLSDPTGDVRRLQGAHQSPWSIVAMRRRVHSIVREATANRRLFVFVEDIDRCKPENALAILEAFDQILDCPNLIAFVGLDKSRLAQQLETAAHLPKGNGRSYLHRLIHVDFEIPAPKSSKLPEALTQTIPDSEPAVRENVEPERFRVIVAERHLNPVSSHWENPRLIPEYRTTPALRNGFVYMLRPSILMTEGARDGFEPIVPLQRPAPWLDRPHKFRGSLVPRTWADWLTWLVPLVVATTFAVRSSATSNETWATTIFMFALVHAVTAAVTTRSLIWLIHTSDMRQLNDHRDDMEAQLQQGATEMKDVTGIAPRLRSRLPGIWHEQVLSRSLNDDPEVKAAQVSLLSNVSVTPRVFKRWTTRLRLALALANSRGLLQSGALTTKQLAAWTLLLEIDEPNAALQQIVRPVRTTLATMRT